MNLPIHRAPINDKVFQVVSFLRFPHQNPVGTYFLPPPICATFLTRLPRFVLNDKSISSIQLTLAACAFGKVTEWDSQQ